MGRIADALRKAQAERVEVQRLGGATHVETVSPQVEPVAPDEMVTPPGMRAEFLQPTEEIAPTASTAPRMGDVDPSIVSYADPTSALAEQYRGLRTWLLRHNTTNEHRSIVVTSSVPREGKSVTALNLAVSLAEVKHLNVLVVDADLRRGRLSSLLSMPSGPGLADVLSNQVTMASAIHPTGIRNLSLLPAGNTTPTSTAELLSTRTTAALFDEVRERYHYVIVDTPAVQSAADVGVIGGLCSGLLMVVRMGRTPEPTVKQSVRWLQSNNLNLLGCVLTAADRRGRQTLHPFGTGVRLPS